MNITINDNLKRLRKERNNTQEDLAEFLTVSITAVSKWERGECYPDIELLPKIASYYGVSVDDLLGVGEICKQKRIKEYQSASNHLRHIGDRQGEVALWREAKNEFPNDWTVLHNLMHALSCADKREHSQEIIEIGDKILSCCTDNEYRYVAMQSLCLLYKTLGDQENALKYANMAPYFHVTRNILLSHVLKGDELVEHCQQNIQSLTEMLCWEVSLYARHRGGINGDEAKYAHHAALQIYELIYPDSDYGFDACRISQIYRSLAEIAAIQKNRKETLDYLSNAIKYSIMYDTQGDFKHTSLLVNRLYHKSTDSHKTHVSNESYLRLKEMESEHFDFCRDDETFAKLMDDVRKAAVSGE